MTFKNLRQRFEFDGAMDSSGAENFSLNDLRMKPSGSEYASSTGQAIGPMQVSKAMQQRFGNFQGMLEAEIRNQLFKPPKI